MVRRINGIILALLLTNAALYAQIDPNAQSSWVDSLIPKLTELALKNYPLNDVVRNRMILAEENLFQARMSWFNSLSFTYQYNPSFNTSSSSTATNEVTFPKFGIGITVNLGNILVTPSKIAQGKAEYAIAEADLRQHINYMRAEVTRRYANYTRAVDMLRIRSQAADDSEQSMRLMKHRYENGEETLEMYNQSLRSYTDNLERRAVADGDARYHKATLEELIGVKLEEVR